MTNLDSLCKCILRGNYTKFCCIYESIITNELSLVGMNCYLLYKAIKHARVNIIEYMLARIDGTQINENAFPKYPGYSAHQASRLECRYPYILDMAVHVGKKRPDILRLILRHGFTTLSNGTLCNHLFNYEDNVGVCAALDEYLPQLIRDNLHILIMYERYQCLSFYIEKHWEDSPNDYLLHDFVGYPSNNPKNKDILALLLNHPKYATTINTLINGRSLLCHAVIECNIPAVKLLCEQGLADPTIKFLGDTPLEILRRSYQIISDDINEGINILDVLRKYEEDWLALSFIKPVTQDALERQVT